MTSRTLLAVIVVASAACAHPAALQQIVTPQSRLGLGEGFGPGIVNATARAMTYQLDMPAHVIILRVLDDGTIEQIRPFREDPNLARGAHQVIATGASPSTLAPGFVPPLPVNTGSLSCTPIIDTNAKADPTCMGMERARTSEMEQPPAPIPKRPRDDEAGYWLLITSDVATSAASLEARVRGLELDEGTLLDMVRQIPGALIAGRTTNWSAFYVGFAVIPAGAAKR